MKIMITFISVLIVLAGVLPFLKALNVLPGIIPTTSPGYQIVIVVVGIIGLVYAFMNNMLMGTERFVTIVLALLTILGGILPFISGLSFIPSFIPTEGIWYSIIIIIIGIIGTIYGITGMG